MASADEDSAKQTSRRRTHKRPASQELTTSTSGDGKRRDASSKDGPDARARRNATSDAAVVDHTSAAAAQDTSERTSMVTTPATEPSATSADKPVCIKHEPETTLPAAPAVAAGHSSPQTRADSGATASPSKSVAPVHPVLAATHAAATQALPAPEAPPTAPQALPNPGLSMSGVAVAVQRELAYAAQQGLQPRLEDIMNALRASGAAAAFPGTPPLAPVAAVLPTLLPASLPAPAPALMPLPAASPAGGIAPYSDGVRAMGAVSPTPAAPTPVVQQQTAPVAAGARPRVPPAAEDDPLMLDAAEVLMTLVKQPGPEATDQSCTVDTATDPTAAVAPGTCSPGSSPHAGSDGTAAAGAAMGTETDGSGRRSSRRRRQPNSRIVDELEPSELEKAWGRGRGRRKLTSDKIATEKVTPERPSSGMPVKGLQPGSPGALRLEGSGATADGGGSGGMLTLEALRQMRERGIPINNLELLVSSEGKWLAAKVYKVDHDFKKVVIKYCTTGQMATLNWHREETKSRVALSRSAVDAITAAMSHTAPPAAAATPQVPQTPPVGALQGSAPVAQPAAAAMLPALAAQQQQAQQQQAALEMQWRLQQLVQLQQHMALTNALQQQQAQQARVSGAPMSMVSHLSAPLMHLAQQQQAAQQQAQQQAAVAAAAHAAAAAQPTSMSPGGGMHGSINPAVLQHVLAQLQDAGSAGSAQHAALVAALLSHAAAPAPVAQEPVAAAAGAAPVRLDADMFPKLLGHLQPGQHKIVCRLTRGTDVRTVALVGVDPSGRGIVAEYVDGSASGRLVVTQADLQNESLRIEALRVEPRTDTAAAAPVPGQAQAAGVQ